MAWKKVINTDPGTVDLFGGDDFDKVADLFSGVLDVDTVDINSQITIRSGKARIANPANSFYYSILGAAILANRNLTIPLMTADDTIAVLNLAQTFNLKTLTNVPFLSSNTTPVADLGKIRLGDVDTIEWRNSTNTNNHGFQIATNILAIFFDSGVYYTFRAGLFDVQDNDLKIDDNHLKISNPAGTFDYIIRTGAILANRNLIVPLLAANDTIAVLAEAQIFLNKTYNVADNSLTATSGALGDSLKHDGTKYIRFAKGTLDQRRRIKSDGTDEEYFDEITTLTFIIDGGGSAITTGQKGHLEIPFACTILGWTILADVSGSIVVDVWKDTYANFPPTVADTIAGTEKPTLASVQKNQDLALATWTTLINAGDILAFNVDSAATVTRVTLSLKVRKRD